MVVALTDRHWNSLLELTGTRDVITALEGSLGADFTDEQARYRYRDVISALLGPWFAERTRAEVAEGLEKGRVLWGDYRSVEELVRAPDSVLAGSELFSEVHQPAVGTFPVPGPVTRSIGWDDPGPVPAPLLGQHTDDVLREWLGHDDRILRGLRDADTVR